MADAATPNLDKIIAGAAIESSDDLWNALREILPDAENWVGRDFVLECDQHGWSVRYTHGNNYRDRLTDRHGYRFRFAENAIQALAERCAKNKAKVEREEAAQ